MKPTPSRAATPVQPSFWINRKRTGCPLGRRGRAFLPFLAGRVVTLTGLAMALAPPVLQDAAGDDRLDDQEEHPAGGEQDAVGIPPVPDPGDEVEDGQPPGDQAEGLNGDGQPAPAVPLSHGTSQPARAGWPPGRSWRLR